MATLESLEEAISGVQVSVVEIKDLIREQNGRQRKNTETIILLCAKLDNVADSVGTNTEQIEGVKKSSGRWDKVLGILTTVITVALVYLGLAKS